MSQVLMKQLSKQWSEPLGMTCTLVADPEGFHRFPLKPPLLDNVYNTNMHLQHYNYSNSGL